MFYPTLVRECPLTQDDVGVSVHISLSSVTATFSDFLMHFEHVFKTHFLLSTAPLGRQSALMYIFFQYVKLCPLSLNCLISFLRENKQQHLKKHLNTFPYNCDCIPLAGQLNLKMLLLLYSIKGIIRCYSNVYFLKSILSIHCYRLMDMPICEAEKNTQIFSRDCRTTILIYFPSSTK